MELGSLLCPAVSSERCAASSPSADVFAPLDLHTQTREDQDTWDHKWCSIAPLKRIEARPLY